MDGRTGKGDILKPGIDISDKDIYEAMKDIPGYLDVTPQDLKEIYRRAYQHAVERLTRSTKARDVMTKEVISVGPETPLSEVARAMAKRGISGVPVVDDEMVVGIISQKDFLALVTTGDARNLMDVLAEYIEGRGCAANSLRAKTAREIMQSPAITVLEDTPVTEIAKIFASKRINRTPVLDGQGRMVGIVSRDDLVKAYSAGSHGVY
jgi:CBS domain-containing protein